MHIWAKFHQNLESGLREVENVFNEDHLIEIVNIGHSNLIWTN